MKTLAFTRPLSDPFKITKLKSIATAEQVFDHEQMFKWRQHDVAFMLFLDPSEIQRVASWQKFREQLSAADEEDFFRVTTNAGKFSDVPDDFDAFAWLHRAAQDNVLPAGERPADGVEGLASH